MEKIKKFFEQLTPLDFMISFYAITSLLTIPIPGHWLIGAGVWIGLQAMLLNGFIVYVPEVTAFALHDKITGKVRGVPPGWHFKHLWEKKAQEISLKTKSQKFTETYNSNDGIEMPTRFGYEYQPDRNNINTFIRIDNSVIEEGVKGVISSALSAEIASKEAVWNREHVDQISKKVLTKFESVEIQKDGLKIGIEEAFGIDVRVIRVEDINYPESYREAKMAQSVAKSNAEAAETYQIDKTVTGKDALNFVQVQQGKSKKTIFDVEGLEDFGKSIGMALAKSLEKGGEK